MPDRQALGKTLASMDGRGYASYKQLTGTYDLGGVRLAIDHVQSDPYAPPSRMRLLVDRATADLPPDLVDTAGGLIAASDFLTRRFVRALSGAGDSRETQAVRIDAPGQQVLERSSVLIAPDRVEARIDVSLPAAGRRIKGHAASRILTRTLPQIADSALRHSGFSVSHQEALRDHVTLYRDQEHLRSLLAERGLIAFVGEGSVLPRASGDSDLPLVAGAVPFTGPESLRVEFDLPSGRQVAGMGVFAGVTVIVGGGYHGKSTLLRAVERGVYPHIAGDGREWVVSRRDATSIRAEDGRAVTGTDISPFITNLPSGTDTRSFTTTNASGSTSQAANLAEAVEAGATALLIDEDTSATNFMIRDERMRRLVPAHREPITPFVDRIRPLFAERGVSTVLVAGGSGAFFDVADHVIALDEYVPRDVTEQAEAIAAQAGEDRTPQAGGSGEFRTEEGSGVVGGDAAGSNDQHTAPGPVFPLPGPRIPVPSSFHKGGKDKPARQRGRTLVQYGSEDIELAAVVQLVDTSQTEAIARALDRLAPQFDGRMSIAEAVALIDRQIDEQGLDSLSPHRGHPGRLARPRSQELLAAVSRYRRLRLEG